MKLVPDTQPLKVNSFCQDHTDYCRVHEGQCVVNKPRSHLNERHFASHGTSSDSLIVNSAGNCCQGWSTEGKRARTAHFSQHPWGCWIAQRKELALRRQEDMFFQECTRCCDKLSGRTAERFSPCGSHGLRAFLAWVANFS